jgi:hypothetical protein
MWPGNIAASRPSARPTSRGARINATINISRPLNSNPFREFPADAKIIISNKFDKPGE